jgi:hypothetical protein
MTAWHRLGLATACVMAAAFLAACSSTSSTITNNSATSNSATSATSATSAASPTSAPHAVAGGPAVCSSVAALRGSVQNLKNVDIKANGLSSVSAAITKIKEDLNTLKADAKGQYSTQINALSGALTSLTSAFDAAKANPNAGTLGTLATSVKSVVTAGNNLVTAVSATC